MIMGSLVSRGKSVLAGLVLGLLVFAVPVDGQTPDQVKAFQSMPKDQRNSLLQQMGLGGTAAGRTAAQGQGQNVDNGAIQVQTSPTDMLDDEDKEVDPKTGLLREKRITGEEQLLIDLQFAGRDTMNLNTEQLPDGRTVTREVQKAPKNPEMMDPDERRRFDPAERKRIDALRERIISHNPYEHSRYGVLQLPGFEPIPMAGLTARQAQQRLSAEPAMRDFIVTVAVLRLDPQGAHALKPFGYDMFRGRANAFVPGTDIPVSSDYRVSTGDVLDVELYGGQKSDTMSLPVARDGTVSLPDIGPINVGGLSFGAAKSAIEQGVGKQMIGTKVRVTMTNLRSTRVFVLGDAEKAGSYVLSGLSTVTAALFASGGVKTIGSLRNIEVKRGGNLVRRLDLYDVLLSGDTANDVRLESGDVVLVPPVGATVSIDGEVRRPAIYELARDRSIAEAIRLAGGLTPDADPRTVAVERVDERHQRTVLSIDVGSPEAKSFEIKTGDVVRVATIRPALDNAVILTGNVHRPGSYHYRDGMLLSDLLTSVDELKPDSDLHYLLVRREDPTTRKLSVFSADLAAALAHPGGPDDLKLAQRDRILVFDQSAKRDLLIAPLMEELKRQGAPDTPSSVVSVVGVVNAEGKYPLEPGMRVSDLLRAGGGLQDAAYGADAELTRYTVLDGAKRQVNLFRVDLGKILKGDSTADTELQPYDVLTIKRTPDWSRVETIELKGEVRFPGVYQIRRGETLHSVLQRAGGLTDLAFPEGAVFTREELKKREREQLDQLAARLQGDLAAIALQSSQSPTTSLGGTQALGAGQGLLDQLHNARPVGRLVINLSAIASGKADVNTDVILRDQDLLVVPRTTQEVSVLGEVQSATSHLYKPHATRDDLIALSGGTTPNADRRHTYVVRADGSVVGTQSSWATSSNVEVRPGDTVVVPLDAGKMRPLPLWTAVTTVIYNLAIAAAAIGRF